MTRKKKITWIVLFLVVAVLMTMTYIAENRPDSLDPEESKYESVKDETSEPESAVNLFAGYNLPENRTLYAKLSEEEQYIYRELYKSVLNDTYVFTLKDAEYEEYIPLLERAAFSVQADFPEFFWLAYATKYEKNPLAAEEGDLKVSVWCASYWNDVMDRRGYIDEMMTAAQKIVDDTKDKYTTQYDRIRYIHDYLVKNVQYDYEAAEMTGSPDQTEENMLSHSAYGAIVNGKPSVRDMPRRSSCWSICAAMNVRVWKEIPTVVATSGITLWWMEKIIGWTSRGTIGIIRV